jgi:DUF4097 and DUF4098 domain-containing protein YvlB
MLSTASLLVLIGLWSPPPSDRAAAIDPVDPDWSQDRPVGARGVTDQSVPVQKGTRINVEDCRGLVTVRTWDRDVVRVRATHGPRTRVQVTTRDQVLLVGTSSEGPGAIDFELTVPEWIGMTLESPWCSTDIENLGGLVAIDTVEGDITLRGLTGSAKVMSVEGTVTIEGGRARVHAHTIEGDIVVTKAGGELVLDSVDGSIRLTNLAALGVEASTIDGDILFSGAFQATGRYLFTTHDGGVTLFVPETTHATFGVRTFSGGKVESTIPLKPVSTGPRGRRQVLTLGNGAAQVEIESFDGTVRIRRPGESEAR